MVSWAASGAPPSGRRLLAGRGEGEAHTRGTLGADGEGLTGAGGALLSDGAPSARSTLPRRAAALKNGPSFRRKVADTESISVWFSVLSDGFAAAVAAQTALTKAGASAGAGGQEILRAAQVQCLS